MHAEEGSAEDIASTAAYATEDLPEPADDDAAVSARLQEAIASSLSALDSSRYYNPLRHVANIQPALEAALSRLARPKKRAGADALSGETTMGHRTPLASMTSSSRAPGAPARSAKRSKRTTKQQRDVGAASLQMVDIAAERRHSLQVFKGREVPSAGAPVPSTSRLTAADYAEADDMMHTLDEMGFDEDDDDDFAVDSFAASRPAPSTSRRAARWQSGPAAAGNVTTAPPRWPAQGSRASGASSGFAAAGAQQHATAARQQRRGVTGVEAMGAAAAAVSSLSGDLGLDIEEPWARPQRSQSQKRHALGETLQQARQSRSILSKRLPKPVAPQ